MAGIEAADSTEPPIKPFTCTLNDIIQSIVRDSSVQDGDFDFLPMRVGRRKRRYHSSLETIDECDVHRDVSETSTNAYRASNYRPSPSLVALTSLTSMSSVRLIYHKTKWKAEDEEEWGGENFTSESMEELGDEECGIDVQRKPSIVDICCPKLSDICVNSDSTVATNKQINNSDVKRNIPTNLFQQFCSMGVDKFDNVTPAEDQLNNQRLDELSDLASRITGNFSLRPKRASQKWPLDSQTHSMSPDVGMLDASHLIPVRDISPPPQSTTDLISFTDTSIQPEGSQDSMFNVGVTPHNSVNLMDASIEELRINLPRGDTAEVSGRGEGVTSSRRQPGLRSNKRLSTAQGLRKAVGDAVEVQPVTIPPANTGNTRRAVTAEQRVTSTQQPPGKPHHKRSRSTSQGKSTKRPYHVVDELKELKNCVYDCDKYFQRCLDVGSKNVVLKSNKNLNKVEQSTKPIVPQPTAKKDVAKTDKTPRSKTSSSGKSPTRPPLASKGLSATNNKQQAKETTKLTPNTKPIATSSKPRQILTVGCATVLHKKLWNSSKIIPDKEVKVPKPQATPLVENISQKSELQKQYCSRLSRVSPCRQTLDNVVKRLTSLDSNLSRKSAKLTFVKSEPKPRNNKVSVKHHKSPEGVKANVQRKRLLSEQDIQTWVTQSRDVKSTQNAGDAKPIATEISSPKTEDIPEKFVESAKSVSLVDVDVNVESTASQAILKALVDKVKDGVHEGLTRKLKRGLRSDPRFKGRHFVDESLVKVKRRSDKGKVENTNPTLVKDIVQKLNETRAPSSDRDKMTESMDSLIGSVNDVVDSRVDRRICWDSSLDTPPRRPGDDADATQRGMVRVGSSVIGVITDTLLQRIQPELRDFEYQNFDSTDPESQMSIGVPDNSSSSLLENASSRNLDRLVKSLLRSKSSALSTWHGDEMPASVDASTHAIAALEDLESLLQSLSDTTDTFRDESSDTMIALPGSRLMVKPLDLRLSRQKVESVPTRPPRQRRSEQKVVPVSKKPSLLRPSPSQRRSEPEVRDDEPEVVQIETMGDATVLTTARLPVRRATSKPPSVKSSTSSLSMELTAKPRRRGREASRIEALAMPKQCHVRTTKSEYGKVLQKPFLDRLDRLISSHRSQMELGAKQDNTPEDTHVIQSVSSRSPCRKPVVKPHESVTTVEKANAKTGTPPSESPEASVVAAPVQDYPGPSNVSPDVSDPSLQLHDTRSARSRDFVKGDLDSWKIFANERIQSFTQKAGDELVESESFQILDDADVKNDALVLAVLSALIEHEEASTSEDDDGDDDDNAGGEESMKMKVGKTYRLKEGGGLERLKEDCSSTTLLNMVIEMLTTDESSSGESESYFSLTEGDIQPSKKLEKAPAEHAVIESPVTEPVPVGDQSESHDVQRQRLLVEDVDMTSDDEVTIISTLQDLVPNTARQAMARGVVCEDPFTENITPTSLTCQLHMATSSGFHDTTYHASLPRVDILSATSFENILSVLSHKVSRQSNADADDGATSPLVAFNDAYASRSAPIIELMTASCERTCPRQTCSNSLPISTLQQIDEPTPAFDAGGDADSPHRDADVWSLVLQSGARSQTSSTSVVASDSLTDMTSLDDAAIYESLLERLNTDDVLLSELNDELCELSAATEATPRGWTMRATVSAVSVTLAAILVGMIGYNTQKFME